MTGFFIVVVVVILFFCNLDQRQQSLHMLISMEWPHTQFKSTISEICLYSLRNLILNIYDSRDPVRIFGSCTGAMKILVGYELTVEYSFSPQTNFFSWTNYIGVWTLVSYLSGSFLPVEINLLKWYSTENK